MSRTTLEQTQFLTVYDFGLSTEEQQLWGGLSRTPQTYQCVDGLSPQDSALIHIVRLLSDRRDLVRARQHACLITDPMARKAQLGLLPPVDT